MKHRFSDENCSVARALEIVGDWRTLLVVRQAFLGVRRFADFEASLGIAKNVLTQRLMHLTEHGVMKRVDAGVHGTRYEYELTAMGKDLATVMTALRQWGDRWVFGEGQEPLLVLDRRTGRPLPRVRMLDEQGQPISARDMEVRPGPGASAETRTRIMASLPASKPLRQAPAPRRQAPAQGKKKTARTKAGATESAARPRRGR